MLENLIAIAPQLAYDSTGLAIIQTPIMIVFYSEMEALQKYVKVEFFKAVCCKLVFLYFTSDWLMKDLGLLMLLIILLLQYIKNDKVVVLLLVECQDYKIFLEVKK